MRSVSALHKLPTPASVSPPRLTPKCGQYHTLPHIKLAVREPGNISIFRDHFAGYSLRSALQTIDQILKLLFDGKVNWVFHAFSPDFDRATLRSIDLTARAICGCNNTCSAEGTAE
jgi:hypothetical protein